jgi:Ribbon-helix-helix protein, copG family
MTLNENASKPAEDQDQPAHVTAVVPVRLLAHELAAVEAVAERTGKTLSQILREALQQRLLAPGNPAS